MLIVKNLYLKDPEESSKIMDMINGIEKNGTYCIVMTKTLNRVAMEKIRVLCKYKLESSSKKNKQGLKYLLQTKKIYIK